MERAEEAASSGTEKQRETGKERERERERKGRGSFFRDTRGVKEERTRLPAIIGHPEARRGFSSPLLAASSRPRHGGKGAL